MVEALLRKGASIDLGSKGITPLLIAAEYGHTDVVKALLNKNASVLVINEKGTTPLYAAAKYGHVDIVKALLSKNAPVNQARKDGLTPLFIAAKEGFVDVVNALLDKGASINMPCQGKTPLYIAAQGNHEQVVKSLLENGADATLPLNMALQKGQAEAINTIIKSLLNQTPLSKKSLTIVENTWNTVKTQMAPNVSADNIEDKLIRYIDTKQFSGHEKNKKEFFIEISVLVANKKLTLENLLDKLEQYKDTDLFYKKMGADVKSNSAKLVRSLFFAVGHPIVDNQLESIVNGQLDTIKKDLLKEKKSRQIGMFPSSGTKEVKKQPNPPSASNTPTIPTRTAVK